MLLLSRMTPSPASSSGEPPAKQVRVSTPKRQTKVKEVVTEDASKNDEEKISSSEKGKFWFVCNVFRVRFNVYVSSGR